MLDVAALARRLTGALPGQTRSSRRLLSPDQVLRYLRPGGERIAEELVADGQDPRVFEALDRVVADLPRVIVEERLVRQHRGFNRYFDALPRIVYLWGRGLSAREIASDMRFIATDFGVETVLALVAAVAARRAALAA